MQAELSAVRCSGRRLRRRRRGRRWSRRRRIYALCYTVNSELSEVK